MGQGEGDQSSQGHITGIFNASVRMHNTLGLKYGIDEANLSTLTFREGDDLMDNGPNLFTGEKNISIDGWNKDQPLILKQTQPLPMSILGIAYTVSFSEHAK